MAERRVFIVHLRRPRSDPRETRADPYWEVGSFGCTGCHRRNLLHPKNASKLEGACLAFAQGGGLGFRLVLVTPPVKIKQWADRCEARWRPARMPFRYENAPVLIRNSGESDFDKLKWLIQKTRRSTLEAAFSSRFRSRARPLDAECAAEIIAVFGQKRSRAHSSACAKSYVDALPHDPPMIETARKRSYHATLQSLKAALRGRDASSKLRGCGVRRRCAPVDVSRRRVVPAKGRSC